MIEASIHSLQREDYFRSVSENYRIKMIRMINSFCCSFGKVEYAIKAIQLGSTAIGVKTSSGIILAVEKRVTSALMEATSVEKAMEIDNHIGTAMSGLIADARTLVDHARIEAQNHRFTYDEPIRTEALAQAVCDLMISFGESGDEKKMSRPFGVALLLAGVDETGPKLFFCDPSGTYVEYKAKAIGSGSESAQTQLTEEYSETMSIVDAELLAVKTLKSVMEEKLSAQNIQVARVTNVGYEVYGEDMLAELVDRIPV